MSRSNLKMDSAHLQKIQNEIIIKHCGGSAQICIGDISLRLRAGVSHLIWISSSFTDANRCGWVFGYGQPSLPSDRDLTCISDIGISTMKQPQSIYRLILCCQLQDH